jgi:hypothetical protein
MTEAGAIGNVLLRHCGLEDMEFSHLRTETRASCLLPVGNLAGAELFAEPGQWSGMITSFLRVHSL